MSDHEQPAESNDEPSNDAPGDPRSADQQRMRANFSIVGWALTAIAAYLLVTGLVDFFGALGDVGKGGREALPSKAGSLLLGVIALGAGGWCFIHGRSS